MRTSKEGSKERLVYLLTKSAFESNRQSRSAFPGYLMIGVMIVLQPTNGEDDGDGVGVGMYTAKAAAYFVATAKQSAANVDDDDDDDDDDDESDMTNHSQKEIERE